MTGTITIEEMDCEQTVEKALEEIETVREATTDCDTKSATIEGSADAAALVSAVEDAGYDASA